MKFPKLSKIKNWIQKGKDTADIGKVFVPPAAPIIEEGEQVAELVSESITAFQKIKGFFKKKK